LDDLIVMSSQTQTSFPEFACGYALVSGLIF